jgi:hypothetical protein
MMEQPVTFGLIEFVRALKERGLEGKWFESQDDFSLIGNRTTNPPPPPLQNKLDRTHVPNLHIIMKCRLLGQIMAADEAACCVNVIWR